MSRYLLDSSIASDYINRRNRVYERARDEVLKGNPVGIGTPVLAELVSGIERSASRDRNYKTLQIALNSLRIWPFDRATAFECGRIHSELLRNGRPMQLVDIMIAAIASTLGNTIVVSKDSDLFDVPGLTVENWTA
jgi:tRNA(fMet)-specific endonuclease VapC